MSKCCDDIITLHSPLIHPAVDIQFQLQYKNGVLDAEIICLEPGANSNVQRVLENYFSQVGIPVKSELPGGTQNGVNLVFTTANEFIPGSLEVDLSCGRLKNGVDFIETTVGPNAYKEFTIVLAPDSTYANRYRLNVAPCEDEPLCVYYNKRITFNTIGGT